MVSGSRCGFCGCALDGAAAEQIGDRWFHAEACAAETRKQRAAAEEPAPAQMRRTAPLKKRSRIKGADTAADVAFVGSCATCGEAFDVSRPPARHGRKWHHRSCIPSAEAAPDINLS